MPIETSFLRITADSPSDQAIELLSGVRDSAGDPIRRAVVHRKLAGADVFYDFELDDVLRRLRARPATRVIEALDLGVHLATPTVRYYPDAVSAPVVVLDAGRILGVARPFTDQVVEAPTPVLTTRALLASAPPQVLLDQEASLLVLLSRDTTGPDALMVTGAVGDEIEVVVEATGAITIRGASEGKLLIEDLEETRPLRFKIAGKSLGDGRLRVYAFKHGQAVGKLHLTVQVVPAIEDAAPTRQQESLTAPAALPELSLYVLEEASARTYTMRLHAADPGLGLNLIKFGPIELGADAESFFATVFRDLESIMSAEISAQAKMQRLASMGTYLFDTIVPEPLRVQLWDLRKRIKSILVQSEEPWIPWELCKLFGADGDGGIAEGGFLCEEFEMTRWLIGTKQYQELDMRVIGVVVPADSDLPAAPAERDFMLGLASAGRTTKQIAAEAVALRDAMASGKYDGLHFTGHGQFTTGESDRAALSLDHGSLTPQDLTGVVANLGRKRHPLVFLNACEAGRSGMSLVGMGGWARGFLKAGAGAFIGPYWKVSDSSASAFAQAFYFELLENGATVGQAARTARAAVRAASDPTWLAYTVYAHPQARAASLPAG